MDVPLSRKVTRPAGVPAEEETTAERVTDWPKVDETGTERVVEVTAGEIVRVEEEEALAEKLASPE
jgi:hypothetical protein